MTQNKSRSRDELVSSEAGRGGGRVCAKCGSASVRLFYVEAGEEATFFYRERQRALPDGFQHRYAWGGGVLAFKNVLHCRCETCQWDWSELPTDAHHPTSESGQ